MKATDLMVGDWVSYKDDPPYIVRGTSICKVVTIDNGIDHRNVMDDAINPIPLTEDILVKNGFEKRIYNPSHKSYHLPNFPLNWNDDDGFWFCDGIYTDYVHQLQHLLRLVGIEKEIEL